MVCLLLLVAAAACSSSGHKAATPSSTTSSLPAAVANAPSNTVWLCEPGKANDPCTADLTTTVVSTSGAQHVEDLKPAANPPVDCFYVYPTVSSQPGPNANLNIDPEEIGVAEEQASQFSQVCRVYAPMYPQLTLSAILSPSGRSADANAKAYQGVADAWHDYLAHHNDGRGVVLIGHSQGSGMLIQLISKEIDSSPAERRLLVSAILLGGNVTVPAGRDVGGDFQHVPTCRAASQTGCVIAFSTFEGAPPANSYFGRPVPITSGGGGNKAANLKVVCTNPAALGGGSGPLQSMFRTSNMAGTLGSLTVQMFDGKPPTSSTAWTEWDGWYTASCADVNGAQVLEVTPVGPAPQLKPEPTDVWGLHLLDVNLSLGNLVSIVQQQGKAFAH